MDHTTDSTTRSLILCLSLVLSLASTATQAIVIRHDRDDARYRELANDYPVVCSVGGGMGTLVDPIWVLTAAHVAETVGVGSEIRCGDRIARVAGLVLHPDYAVEGKHRDLAMVRLEESLDGGLRAELYAGNDEIGQTVVFVGEGDTGTGLTGPSLGEPVLRAARNVVSGVRSGWVEFDFDAPPGGDDLEGISGPGDSGGPALVERDGTLYVIGVSAYNDGEELCTYGTKEHYARVSDERKWIDGVMRGEVSAGPPRALRHATGSGGQATVRAEPIRELPASEALVERTRRAARELIEAINTSDLATFRSLFSDDYLRREGADSVDSMLGFMDRARDVRGDIVSMHPAEDRALATEDGDAPMVPVIWHLGDGTPGYFGLVLDDEGTIEQFSLFVRAGICREGPSCSLTVPLAD